MRYAEILKSLDEKIKRLQQARDLLAGMSRSSRGPRKKTRAARKPTTALEPQAAASTPPVRSVVQVQRLPYRNKTRPQRVRRPPLSSLTSTALTGYVPSGPIAISADEARKARQREGEVKHSPVFAPDGDRGSERSLSSLVRAMMSREAAAGGGTS